MPSEVVVGVDGTVSSQRAVLWAAEAARARSADLVLVHATLESEPRVADEWSKLVGTEPAVVLRNEQRRAGQAAPGLVVRAEAPDDSPARALVRRSRTASVVVVGTRRMTRCARPWSGMLEYQVVAGSTCDVVVVPPVTGLFENRLVVGTDGSRDGQAAVTAAADLAVRLGAVLEVLHAWQRPGGCAFQDEDEAGLAASPPARLRRLLGAVVDRTADARPGLTVEGRLVESHPVPALLAAASGSRVLVVGARGRQRVQRVRVGSTSHALTLSTPCALVVARGG